VERRVRFLQTICFWAAVAALAVGVLRFGIPLLWPFLGGLALAYLFKQISRRLHLRGGAPVAAIAVLFYLAVVLLFWVLIAFAADRLLRLAQAFPVFLSDVLGPAVQTFGERAASLSEQLAPAFALSLSELFDLASSAAADLAGTLSRRLLSAVTGAVRALPTVLIGFLFLIVSSIYISMDYTRVTRFLMRQVPPRVQPLLLDTKNFLTSCLFRTLRAYAIIFLVTFTELCIGMRLLRIGGIGLAALIAALDILPMIGSGIFLLPWGFYHLIAGNPGTGLGLLTLYAIITVARQIIEPRIVGDQLGLHPVATLTAMFLGLRLIGVWGVFLAPFAVMLARYLTTVEGVRLYRPEEPPRG